MADQQLTIKVISYEAYAEVWRQTRDTWPWPCLFTLPFWLEAASRHVGPPGTPHIVAVYDSQGPIGVMPLALEGDTARFLGNPEVCDYQDLVSAPGQAQRVLAAALDHLKAQGIRRLDLGALHPEAVVLAAREQMGERQAASVIEPVDVTHEVELPDSWEGYLQQLNGKQRHEVRRKVRRLESQGRITYRQADLDGGLEGAVDTFVGLFRCNRPDKALFMCDSMVGYFRVLIRRLAEHRLLRLFFLHVNDHPAATVLCFDYLGVRYLYNSGYDDQFEHLGVGTLSKVFSIRSGIEMGCRRFDFLKGAEAYKRRIGGREIPLYRFRVAI